MSAALAEKISDAPATAAPVMVTATPDDANGGNPLNEVRLGFEQLRVLNHDDLRKVISRRVDMLETVLRERGERRAAIDTAKLASKMLDLRRQRALRIRKRVDIASAIATIAGTVLIFVVML